MKPDILIGIDPGVHTGMASYFSEERKLAQLISGSAVEMEVILLEWHGKLGKNYAGFSQFHVYVEDTRNLRLPRALQNQGRLKGAGSVHRDMGRWEEFLTYHKIPFTMCGLSPK